MFSIHEFSALEWRGGFFFLKKNPGIKEQALLPVILLRGADSVRSTDRPCGFNSC